MTIFTPTCRGVSGGPQRARTLGGEPHPASGSVVRAAARTARTTGRPPNYKSGVLYSYTHAGAWWTWFCPRPDVLLHQTPGTGNTFPLQHERDKRDIYNVEDSTHHWACVLLEGFLILLIVRVGIIYLLYSRCVWLWDTYGIERECCVLKSPSGENGVWLLA